MSQHTGSHKNILNLLGEKYLNESHWPMHRIRLLECIQKWGLRGSKLYRCVFLMYINQYFLRSEKY